MGTAEHPPESVQESMMGYNGAAARKAEPFMPDTPRGSALLVVPQKMAKWLPVLIEAWIAATLVTFFVVRILGSRLVQGLLHKAGR